MKPIIKSSSGAAAQSAKIRVAKEEITKAAQTAQLLRSDLGGAYKAAEDALLQIVLLRLLGLADQLLSEVSQLQAAMDDRD